MHGAERSTPTAIPTLDAPPSERALPIGRLIPFRVQAKVFPVLSAAVLVLNRSFLPIQVTTARRAFRMLYQGIARAVNEQYETFDFHSWCQLSSAVPAGGVQLESIGSPRGAIRVPRVIWLQAFDRLPRREVRFSRANIYARDRDTCQYCARRLPRSELNLDHVIPRAQGGSSTWYNVVCSCVACNRDKGGRTPEQAGMRLVARPYRPRWNAVAGLLGGRSGHPTWLPFLRALDVRTLDPGTADGSYWNVELVER